MSSQLVKICYYVKNIPVNTCINNKVPESCSNVLLTCFLLVEGIVCYMSEFPAVL